MSNKIVELMQVAPEEHDLQWLQESLQAAVELEFATLPPYLSGLWSIKDPNTSDPDGIVANLVLSVIMEEMLHMGLTLNMLVAVGGTPTVVAPPYPGHLPGGVRPELEVFLSGLTKDSVAMFMQIEMPEEPVAFESTETFPTIGAFYDAIADAFRALSPSITQTRQIHRTIDVPDPDGPGKTPLTEDLILITSVADAEQAIATIKTQGEGVTGTPDSPDNELAHYYRFGEIFHGKKLVEVTPGKFEFSGDPVPFPDCWPVAKVPPGGYGDKTKAFNTAYGLMISQLEDAWTKDPPDGGPGLLRQAIGTMFGLTTQAGMLVTEPLNGGPEHLGPDFIPIAPAATGEGTGTTAPPATTGVGFASDVLPLFRPIDIAHMKRPGLDFPLDDFSFMTQPGNAANVVARVTDGTMPPPGTGDRWPPEKIAVVQAWIDGGMKP